MSFGTIGNKDPAVVDGGDGDGDGGSGKLSGQEGSGEKKIFTNIKFRTYAQIDTDGRYVHHVLLKGPANKELEIEIKAGTDSSFDVVSITEATVLGKNVGYDGNKVEGIRLDSKGFIKLKIIFDTEEKYSLNVTAYENS